MRGIRLTQEDKLRRSIINRILCHTLLVKSEIENDFGIDFDHYFAGELQRLRDLERDGLVRVDDHRVEVTPVGRVFIRNVAMTFDSYLRLTGSERPQVFSTTV